MKWLLLAWVLSLSAPLALAAPEASPPEAELHACFDERDQSAYLYRSETGAWRGAALELVERSFAQTGLRLRLHAMPWGRCLREVAEFGRRGQFEALFYASRNAERDGQFLASEPLHWQRGGVWYSQRQLAQPPRLRQLQDLGDYRLCGMAHHNYEWLKSLGVRQIDSGAPSLQAVMTKLALGRCELVISSWEAVRGSEARGQLAPDADRAFLPYPAREPAGQHLMLARESPRARQLLERFNRALAQLRASGAADEIYRRYFDAPETATR